MQDTYRKRRTVASVLGITNGDIYTCPDRYNGDVNSIIASNATANTVTVSLDWYNTSTTTWYTIMEQVEIKPYSLVQLTEFPLYLQKTEKIRGLASATTSVTVTVAVEEHFNGTAA